MTALVLVASASAQIRPKHLVTINDLESLREATYLEPSRDGRFLAYEMDETVWLLSTKGGNEPKKLVEGTIPRWSPDGTRLAYYSRQSGSTQLWVLDVAEGKIEQVTHLAGGIDPSPQTIIRGWSFTPFLYDWSPNGTRLAFASQVEFPNPDAERTPDSNVLPGKQDKAPDPLVLTSESPIKWMLTGVFSHGFGAPSLVNGKITADIYPGATSLPRLKKNEVFIADLAEKTVTQLTTDGMTYFHPEWSPDGKTIVCASSEGRDLPATTNLYVIDIASGKKRSLTSGTGQKWLPRWSPDGQKIAYLSGMTYLGQQSLVYMPTEGGTAVNLTAGLDRNVQDFHWLSDDESIVVNIADGVTQSLLRASVSTRKLDRLSPKGVGIRWLTSVSRGGVVAWEQSDAGSHGVVYVLHPGTNVPYVVRDFNPQIRDWELGAQEIVRWKNRKGDILEGILIKPVGYREGHKYPLIVDCYPASRNSFKGAVLWGNQGWASRGYVVFYPNAPAPHIWVNNFKSEADDTSAKGPMGWDVTVDDVMSGVDTLIARGVVDPNSMGLYGFSNGGGVVNYLVTRTGRFKCAVSVAGALADWVRPVLLGTNAAFPTMAAGMTPWDDPAGYIRLSAVFHARAITTPMLLADGDEDGDFLLDSIEMYNSLRWFGRNVMLLRYPGQGHGFTGAALQDFWRRENAFFDRYLKSAQATK